MKQLYERYKLTLTTITRLHIGSGQDLDPTDYVVRGNDLYVLNKPAYLRHLLATDPVGLKAAMNKSYTEIGAYLNSKFDPGVKESYTARYGASDEFSDFYRNNLSNPGNQMLVKEFIHTGGVPYIPGSSLKGALRTGYLGGSFGPVKVYDRDFEKNLLRYDRIPDDPFKWLKVTDMSVSVDDLWAFKVEVRYKNDSAKPGRNLDYHALATDYESEAQGEMLVQTDWTRNQCPFPEFMQYVGRYYSERLEQQLPVYKRMLETGRRMPNFDTGDNQILVKLGHGTGNAFMSLSPRDTKTMQTIERYPLGWCLLTYERID